MVREKDGTVTNHTISYIKGSSALSHLRNARFHELDNEFRKQSRRLSRMVARLQKTKP